MAIEIYHMLDCPVNVKLFITKIIISKPAVLTNQNILPNFLICWTFSSPLKIDI